MSRYENDDPIQEVSKGGFFSRLKRFEDDEEYNSTKREKMYINNSFNNTNLKNYYSETNLNNSSVSTATSFLSIGILLVIIFGCFLPIYIAVIISENMFDANANVPERKIAMPFETSLGTKNPILDDEYDNVLFAKLEFIDFKNAGSIPTLYKYDKNTSANWCNYTELDHRFTFNVNTIQFNYENIPQGSKYNLTQGLINRHYELVNNYPTGELYAINRGNGYFTFVLVSSNDIIYGAAQGNYEDVFNVKKNN